MTIFDKAGKIIERQSNSRAGTSPSEITGNLIDQVVTQGVAKDPRVRISPKTAALKTILGPNKQENIMTPLYSTGGVLFPYTPTIQAGFSVEYGSYAPVHSNQEFQAYNRTPSPTFTISGQFTCQTREEGLYSLAVVHFFRTITKMYFGDNGSKNGITPPTLLLSGYGDLIFNKLPILVTQYTIELLDSVDYVRIDTGKQDFNGGYKSDYNDKLDNTALAENGVGRTFTRTTSFKTDDGIAWLPSKFMITVSCVVNHTPKQMTEFNLEDFRTGNLLKGKGKYYRSRSRDSGGWW